ncbi:hypothetical protein [Streptomyces sp. STCH 565 A]|uniref:hypothetical protein n=1 Tax=Streptomyces sp. STCH 565 A TaxID=2950532 RepID=UPI0020759CD0|nr:hypothetical protein [Streptomyces sp. STCH 565 A]MCM8555526.1 hypothetical protein [Streptomyces sp. STCH 565 A]
MGERQFQTEFIEAHDSAGLARGESVYPARGNLEGAHFAEQFAADVTADADALGLAGSGPAAAGRGSGR